MSIIRHSDESDDDDGSSKKDKGKQKKNNNNNKADEVGSSKTDKKKQEMQEMLKNGKKAVPGGTEVGTSKSAPRLKMKGNSVVPAWLGHFQ